MRETTEEEKELFEALERKYGGKVTVQQFFETLEELGLMLEGK
ncbi:hypothetical protein QF028_003475 [Neobacillus sp. B4I6]